MRNLIKLIRVNNWVKNLIVFFPGIFSGKLFLAINLAVATKAFLAFAFASSIIYIVNDIFDKKEDQLHELKRKRPIASGAVSLTTAKYVILLLSITCIALLLSISSIKIMALILMYITNNMLYNLFLKKVVIIDVLSISIGFIIRVLVGCVAFNVLPSNFILATTFFCSLFLALSKRSAESTLLGSNANAHRSTLQFYQGMFVNSLILLSGALALTSYLLYSIFGATAKNESYLIYTNVFVVYCTFKIFYHIYFDAKSSDPVYLLYEDKWILTAVISWLILILFCYYG